MNNILKTAFIVALGSLAFTSCRENDDTDYEAQYLKAEKQVDSLLSAQKIAIEAYKAANLANAKEDTVNYTFNYLDKKVKRGIWYFVNNEPTDNTYSYGMSSTGQSLLYPKLKLKYTAKLLNNTIVESDITPAGGDYNLGVSSSKITPIWYFSFYPYSLQFNGSPVILGGLTKDGLKKGSKMTVITPSIYAYGSTSKTDIPANSPLVYEFEVVEIANP